MDVSSKDQPAAPKLFAVIDIGATAIRLEIAEINADGEARTIDNLRRAVHLGKDTFTTGRIQQSTIEECVGILKDFRRVMEEYGVTEAAQVRAVATSSVREAANRDTFLDRIYIATGINVEAIEEPEETRLTYMAVEDIISQDPNLRKGDVLIIEVGGGDTELLLVKDGFVVFSNTYRLGSLRMRETLDTRYATSQKMNATFVKHIRMKADQIRKSVPFDKVPVIVAVSGDARFAASQLADDWETSRITRVNIKPFAALAKKMAPIPVEDLVKKHKLSFQEAETTGPALLCYAELAKVFGTDHLLIPKASLRQGLLREVASGSQWTPEFVNQVLHSALALGHKYGFDLRHGRQVADISLKLYEELQSEHHLAKRYALLLEVAALLHEIGLFINNRAHHKHSMYAILNSDLFGMNRHDMLMIALVARYHRRTPPQPYHEGYNSLERDDRMIVSKLAAILRVADALDRNHMQQVRDLSFKKVGQQFVIYVHDVEDLSLERVALKEKGSMFDDVYGMRVALEIAKPTEGLTADV